MLNHHRRLRLAVDIAQDAAKEIAGEYMTVDSVQLSSGPGDQVLLRNHKPNERNKIQDRWVPYPFLVIRQNSPDVPAFTVRLRGRG